MARLLAGRYRIGDQIGAGGSARVHRGMDERLARPVAIKMLDARGVAHTDPNGRERFIRESQTAASFVHPHAVTMFDAGEDDETLFMVMELVEGPSLSAHLASHPGPLPVVDALAVTDHVLAALAAAHEQGIVHRDVKPANILLTGDWEAKLADFGIARRFDDLEAALTGTGLVLGTPRYLAPEQVQGKPVGPSTDVYAVGLVAFEMLTGEVPLVGDTPAATAVARQTQPVPDLRQLRPEVPKGVVRVIERALARHPDTRFADARKFREELRRAVGYDSTSPVQPITARLRAVSAGTETTKLVASRTAVLDRPPADTSDQPRVADYADGPPTQAIPAVLFGGRDRRPMLVGAAVVLLLLGLFALSERGSDDLTELAAGSSLDDEHELGDEIVPGFYSAPDLWGVVAQLERDPEVVGPVGDNLLTGLRSLLSDDSPEWHRAAAQALLTDIDQWIADGHLHEAVAEELRSHLEPLASEPLVEPATPIAQAEPAEPVAQAESVEPVSQRKGPPGHARDRGPGGSNGRGGPPPGRGQR